MIHRSWCEGKKEDGQMKLIEWYIAIFDSNIYLLGNLCCMSKDSTLFLWFGLAYIVQTSKLYTKAV